MPDLDRRFRALDRLDTPDVRADIWHRSQEPEPPIPGPRVGARLIAAAVAIAIVATAAALAARELRHHAAEVPPPSPVGGIWRDLPEGLSSLPAPPRAAEGMSGTWGGGAYFLWGGRASDGKPHRNEGVLFDTATQTWRSVAPSPLSPRSWFGAVWTGTEFVIWGGSDGESPATSELGDGAAYNPSTDTWRMLADAPIGANSPLTTTWTGSEVVFWGSYSGRNEGTGAAYDPAGDTWRALPDVDAPFTDASSVWTGSEVVIFGARLGPLNHPETAAKGVAYDSALERWRSLPDSDLVPNSTDLAWDGERLVAMDYSLRVQTLDDAAGHWVDLSRLPANACEGGLSDAAVEADTILVSNCGELLALDQGATRWHVVLGRGEGTDGLYYGSVDAADGAFLVSALTADGEGEQELHVYRPPSSILDGRQAWDVAAAFGALRSHYPYDADNVPPEVQAEMATLLTPSVAQQYEERSVSGLRRLWAYYYGFEVIGVEGDHAPFTAVVRFTADESFNERLTIGPGVAQDGVQRDFVVLSAEPTD